MEVENLSHIVSRCPHWHKERRQVELPEDDQTVPACVKLHGLLLAAKVPSVITHEPVLVHRTGVTTVWTDGSGRHSSDPLHRRCGVGDYTDTQEREYGYRSQGSNNRCTDLNFLRLCAPLKNASRMKMSVTATGSLRPSRPYKPDDTIPPPKKILQTLLPGQKI
eukprot:1723173-Amphidinium_carterae.1